MKTTEMLLAQWNKAEAMRLAATMDRQLWDEILGEHAGILKELMGYKRLDPLTQHACGDLERQLSPCELVTLLHILRVHQIGLEEFVVAAQSAGATSLAGMLAQLNRKKGPANN